MNEDIIHQVVGHGIFTVGFSDGSGKMPARRGSGVDYRASFNEHAHASVGMAPDN